MEKKINGIQQIGIGVVNANSVFNWYRKYLGFDILVFKDEATASLMTRYTGNAPHKRSALLSMNMMGGGGLEIWQFKDRKPLSPLKGIEIGDLGINAIKIRTYDIRKCHELLHKQPLKICTDLTAIDQGTEHFFFTDPWDNLVQMVQDGYQYFKENLKSGGVLGTVMGVSNMDQTVAFYSGLLGFDRVVYDRSGRFKDFAQLPGGLQTFRRVLIRRSSTVIGGFGALLGPAEIELVEVLDRLPEKIYKDRYWGDLGYIHLCFDVHGMEALREAAKAIGHPFTVDSANSFDMGEAAGHFSYIEDPDGTLLEFVETHKVPIVKNLGLYLNLKKRNPHRPLPKWMTWLLRIHRVRKDL